MIKLFRKLRQNTLSEQKFSRYMAYAIGEIILVVIGILIALSINNWNENRKREAKETYYLNSIKTSIALSQNELARVINDAKEISSSAKTLFDMLAHEHYDKLEGIALDSLLWGAKDYSLITLNDAGIQEILNTGSLDIIQDESIRIILASWNERIHGIQKFESETEYLSRKYNEFLDDYIDVSRWVTDSIASIVIPARKSELLESPKLRNYLQSIGTSHRHMGIMYTEEKIFLDSLDTKIDKYLKYK